VKQDGATAVPAPSDGLPERLFKLREHGTIAPTLFALDIGGALRARDAKPVVWVIAAVFLYEFAESGGGH
jgi:hypothetical protein